MKRIYSIEEFCLGCRLCEIHCLVHHSRSKKIIKAFRHERETVVPAVKVEESGYVSFALQCRHRDDAPCLEACITGAMYRDPETGTILHDKERFDERAIIHEVYFAGRRYPAGHAGVGR